MQRVVIVVILLLYGYILKRFVVDFQTHVDVLID